MFSKLYKPVSLVIEVILLLLMTLIGTRAVDAVSRYYDTAFHTISLLISFIFSFLLHFLLRILGQLTGGLIHGMQLLGIELLGKVHVRERNHFYIRERLPEMEISSILMAPAGISETSKNRKQQALFFYFWGGCLLDLIFTLLSFFLLRTGFVSCETFAGSFLFSFFLSGLWMLVVFGFPLYRAGLPNDGLKACLIAFKPQERALFYEIMRDLSRLSEGTFDPTEEGMEALDTEPFEEDGPISLFAVLYLNRAYEQAMWAGDLPKADHLLSLLYQHRQDVPEDMREALMEEAIFCLSKNTSEDSLELSDTLMNEQRLARMENENTLLSGRSLYQWSLHHLELEDKKWSYLERIKKQLGNLPYPAARKAWMGTIDNG
ncbi:MAG: hypothetical protein J6P72_03405 [Firmicutes bacterium]|nr:hypothetical protein [Bacillota bacterium]